MVKHCPILDYKKVPSAHGATGDIETGAKSAKDRRINLICETCPTPDDCVYYRRMKRGGTTCPYLMKQDWSTCPYLTASGVYPKMIIYDKEKAKIICEHCPETKNGVKRCLDKRWRLE